MIGTYFFLFMVFLKLMRTQEILTQIPAEKIIWEAPQKAQQLYFIELIGCNVNLGNIAPAEVIPLEAMRIGLRGDTFTLYLDKKENA